MPADLLDRRLFIGRDLPATRALGSGVGADLVPTPDLSGAGDGWDWPWRDRLGEWADELRQRPRSGQVAICTWAPPAPPADLCALDEPGWRAQVELPIAIWFTAVSVAIECCEDNGSVVVVAERPAALDAAGRADLLAVADGLMALTRCAALIEGERGVRCNLVTTELFSAPEALLGMPPPLSAFPGAADREVAGAIEMLWSTSAAGVTGTVIRADCGRAW